MSRLSVIGSTHQSFLSPVICVLPHISKHQRGDGNQYHQQPHAHKDPGHDLLGDEGRHPPWKHDSHQPVHAHQGDEEDGGVHVDIAQVEQAFAQGIPEDPGLHGQVDDEEDGEGHEAAVGTGQVEDEERGDRAPPDACQDAPDDEEVAGDAQEEDQAQDEGAQGGGHIVAHHTFVFFLSVVQREATKVTHFIRFDPEDETNKDGVVRYRLILKYWSISGLQKILR